MKPKFSKDLLVYKQRKIKPALRIIGKMRQVIAFPEKECNLSYDAPTYFMYRGIEKFGHIRYDITRIPSLDLCGEHNKTFGHEHPKSPKGAKWPEVYEVLEGKAHFLLQKVSQLGVEDALLVDGKKGDCLLIPPGYGHVTINPGKTELVLANLVSETFSSDYSKFAQRRGACFYETIKDKLIKNPNYGEGFNIRKMDASKFCSSFGCFAPFKGKSLLEAAKNYENIEFLQKPELFY